MTTYDEVKKRFLSKIISFKIGYLDEDVQDVIFDAYLMNAIPKFRYCRKSLKDRNDEERTFHVTLSDTELDILSSLCVLEWTRSKIASEENFEKFLSTKDFRIFSPANQLKELRNAHESLQYEVYSQINFYRFDSDASEV